MLLSDSKLDLWYQHFILYEGISSHMYLDGEGIVTIGVGCVIHDVKEIPLNRLSDNKVATAEEALSEYRAIKTLPNGRPLSFYKSVCKLYMRSYDIKTLFRMRLEQFIRSIESSLISDFEKYPEDAQLVLVDMCFNLGVGGLRQKFPRFLASFESRDWHKAALECKRLGIQAARNEWTRKTLESLEV